MPGTTSGEAVSSADRRQLTPERAWYIFKYVNEVSAEDPKRSFIAGFERAYKDSLIDQTDFIELRAMLRRMLDLLEQLAIERDVVRAVASGEVEI
jgi:hypothetical protein